MLLKWAGGKSWLTKNHPNIFHSEKSLDARSGFKKSVKFNSYVEPFLGSGAVFKYLSPQKKSTLADINSELICFYNSLKTEPEELYSITKEHMKNHSKNYYYTVRSNKYSENIDIAARFLYLNRTCFNGIYRVNSKGEFNVPIGDTKNFSFSKKDFIECSQLLKNCNIVKQDFTVTINEAKKGDLIYADPPYITIDNKSSFNMYSKNQFNWNSQKKLADILESKNKEGVLIIVSNINDKNIKKLFLKKNGWRHLTFNRANVMSYNSGGKEYKEVLFKNF